MKNLKNTLLTLTLVTLTSTDLGAMDQAPKDVMQQLLKRLDPKNAIKAELAGCQDRDKLYASLEKLLQTYSVDVLVPPLKDYFKNNLRLLFVRDQWGITVLHCAVSRKNEAMVELLLKAAGEKDRQLVYTKDVSGDTVFDDLLHNYNEAIAQLLKKYS